MLNRRRTKDPYSTDYKSKLLTVSSSHSFRNKIIVLKEQESFSPLILRLNLKRIPGQVLQLLQELYYFRWVVNCERKCY